eukprot:Lithocolla_globosa_v1_NODE_218_length_5069_cov_37.778620.p6 type:complete len:113 gc:universal NODE_218_length_5069_cov_37.778620:2556-2218(-)
MVCCRADSLCSWLSSTPLQTTPSERPFYIAFGGAAAIYLTSVCQYGLWATTTPRLATTRRWVDSPVRSRPAAPSSRSRSCPGNGVACLVEPKYAGPENDPQGLIPRLHLCQR